MTKSERKLLEQYLDDSFLQLFLDSLSVREIVEYAFYEVPPEKTIFAGKRKVISALK